MEILNSEKYSRGRRGAPAKGVGRATGARVQIPLSPLFQIRHFSCENSKKTALKKIEKNLKKLLTNRKRCGIINKLSPRTAHKQRNEP